MSPPSSKTVPLPFAGFIRSIKSAKYAAYAGMPGAQVASEPEFVKMKGYLLAHYRGVKVENSFVDKAGAVFDCVVTSTQPSLRNSSTRAAPPPGLPSPEPPGIPPEHKPRDRTESPTPCSANAIPLRRIALDDLVRSGTLQNYLQKSPDERLPTR